MKKIEGIVKWFAPEKGFGFIVSGETEVFVHYSSIEGAGFRSLAAGQKILFEPGEDKRGPVAVNVEIKNN
ncbi:MAG: cold-shock protein [Actinomycetota bacterium]